MTVLVLLAVLALDPVNRAIDRGDFPLAMKLASQYAAANPKSAAAQVAKARAAMGLGDGRSALGALRAALRIDPANADALYYTAKLSLTLSQQQFELFRKASPDSARVHLLMAEALGGRNDVNGQRRELEEALMKDVRFVPALTALGDLERAAGNCEAAIKHYRQAAALDPANYDAVYGTGACHLASGNALLAIQELRRAVAIDPSSVAARIALGGALLRAERIAEGVALLEQVLGDEPAAKQAYALLGRAYQRLGRADDAARAFERYRELDR